MESALPYIEVGHFEADGANVALTWDIDRNPDFFMCFNYTKYGTDASNIAGVWFKDFPAGDALVNINEADAAVASLETTNGITVADSVAYSESNNQVSASHTLTFTLGSALRGADSDEVYYIAIWGNKFVDRGDINA